jgi:hypothetical protein
MCRDARLSPLVAVRQQPDERFAERIDGVTDQSDRPMN